MSKRFLFTALVLFAIIANINSTYAQKPRMYVKEFTKANEVSGDDYNKVRAAVISALNLTERFELLDAATISSIAEEEERRQSESAMHDETARNEQKVTKANNYILDGTVTACTVKSNSKDGKTAFTCVLTYSLTVTDYASNTTVASKKFDHSPTGLGGALGKLLDESTSAEGAKTSAINSIKTDIENFLIEEFPLRGEIYAEDFVTKKDKVTHCYINLGSNVGVKNGDWFAIYEVQTKVGKTIEKEIGRLKVTEADEEISNCKVTKGEKEVKKALDRYFENIENDPDTKLLRIKSIPEPLLAF
ncbi:MAG: hypothetical protein J6J37_03660 [Bacteroidaceae bacterium]|nr:hypothetical protein [Bacteroidaceae bacterium]